MTPEADRFYMGLALDLARKGLGRTSPNPPVGCVIAKEGRIVGRGFHPKAGEPHAEVFALQEAGSQAAGADLYVTLEPCSHQGRTPACAERIARSGVRRVVAAVTDPNPRVAGDGVRLLQSAGIRVDVGVLEHEACRLIEGFSISIRQARSFVHLKLAATLDGKIATQKGDSRWISSEESRRVVHELRDLCGAILVGAGTAAVDDPRLSVRLPGRPERRILRYVLDPSLRIPLRLRMLSPEEAPHTVIVCAEGIEPQRAARYASLGAEVLCLPMAAGHLDLRRLLSETYRRGRMEVLVEGGSETARAFLDGGLVDRLHLFLSPRILGGRGAVPMVGGASPDRIDEAIEIKDLELGRVGPDLYVTGIPAAR